MTQEKIILAYCIENEAVAREIATALRASNFEFQAVGCGANGNSLKNTIGVTDANVLLLISDNFLKSIECMEGGLSYLQKLINNGRTLPLIIDGEYANEVGKGVVKVPTKFERVSSVIKYMNYWQDEYLDMRKQKRNIPPAQQEQFGKQLKVVRSISSEVGEFLRFLRESYYCDLDTFKASDYQLFFQKYSNEQAYNEFLNRGQSSRSAFEKGKMAVGSGMGAAAVTAAVVKEKVVEKKEVAPIETPEKVTVEAESVSENVQAAKQEAISEMPAEAAEAVSQELAEDEVIDKLVDDILNEEETLTKPEIIEEVADLELKQIPTVAEDLSKTVTLPAVETVIEQPIEVAEAEVAVEETNTLELEPLVAATAAGAVLAASTKETEIATEKPTEAFIPLKESDLLRTSHDLIQQGSIKEGLALLTTNLEVNPEMVAARYQYAVFLAQFNNDYKAASEQLEVILTKDPKNLPANFFLGELAEAQGDFLLARNYYERVEALSPNFPNLQYKLGLLLSRRYKDKFELAAHYLQNAYERNPRNIDALYNLGVVQNEGLSMPLDAIASFKQVLEEQPQHAFVNYDLALANYKIGDRKSALAYYEKACILNKELKTPENDLAFAIVEEEETISVEQELVTNDNLGATAIAGAAMTQVVSNGSTNSHAAATPTPSIQETEEPAYTLEVGDGLKEERLIETEELEDLGTIDLAELIDQGNREVTEDAGIDEERLEAEFDAQIGALGAAGLGIAAGAAIKEDPISVVAERAALPTEILEAPVAETVTEIIDTAPEAVATPAAIPVKNNTIEPVNKVVLITGATSGIGKATAVEFAKNGYDLILTGRRFSRLFKLKEEFETTYGTNIQLLPFDVRSSAAVKSAIDELEGTWKNVDILINNAGLAMGFDPIHEGSLEDWDTMIDTNIKGLLYMTRAVAPFMVKRKKGHIINISSIAGKEVYPNGNVYCASKHAVEALTKAMRIDLHKYNIRVSQVAPGHVEETEFAQVRFHGDREKAKIYEDFVPINSRDVAEMIYFIATRPPHVNVQDILMMGTQQASALITDKSGRT